MKGCSRSLNDNSSSFSWVFVMALYRLRVAEKRREVVKDILSPRPPFHTSCRSPDRDIKQGGRLVSIRYDTEFILFLLASRNE